MTNTFAVKFTTMDVMLTTRSVINCFEVKNESSSTVLKHVDKLLFIFNLINDFLAFFLYFRYLILFVTFLFFRLYLCLSYNKSLELLLKNVSCLIENVNSLLPTDILPKR